MDGPMRRRARPLLGTLVDVAVPAHGAQADAALAAAFDAVAQVERLMSAHRADSDLGRSLAAPADQAVPIHPWTAEVLQLAAALHAASGGRFDVALGTGRWSLLHGDGRPPRLVRHAPAVRLDLGGLAKGWAVDAAVQAAQAAGAPAVWVNAGGDVRVQGMAVPIDLRDEVRGGVRAWGELEDGALATSDFRPGARAVGVGLQARHVSVAAPRCAWADGLTKVVAACGSPDHPVARAMLRHYEAQAWIHA